MSFNSLRIGRIAGISIELHWTFILLLIFSLYISELFFILILLLFLCVLIHELAHSITAIRNKVSVRKIVLLPIGGASIIDDIRMNPKVELKIALAGPVMSLFLGLAFGALATITPLGPITFLAQSLFLLNIFMALFNILPAFPMDGGRVFRSYLERKKNYFDATILTVKISKYLMVLIIIATFLFLLLANSYSWGYREFIVFWNLIIVVFLYGGAQSEEQALIIRRKTQGLYVTGAKSRRYVLLKSNTKIQLIYSKMKKNLGIPFITKVGKEYMLLDIATNTQVGKRKTAQDIATVLPSIPSKTNVFDALTKMQSLEVLALAIVEKERLVGIVTYENLQAFIAMQITGKKAT